MCFSGCIIALFGVWPGTTGFFERLDGPHYSRIIRVSPALFAGAREEAGIGERRTMAAVRKPNIPSERTGGRKTRQDEDRGTRSGVGVATRS